MNLKHLNIAIAVMQRVVDERRPFDMRFWQRYPKVGPSYPVKTEESMHACGTAACFAGWLAVSPEFQAAGGEVGPRGVPMYGGFSGEEAIASFLGMSSYMSWHLCAVLFPDEGGRSAYYKCPHADITAQMVLDKLIALREAHS